jgi:hypothetical protein
VIFAEKDKHMDWIEQWFGFAPDNGDGTLELLIMLVVAAVIVVAVVWRVPRARSAAMGFFVQLHTMIVGRREG